MGHAKHLIRLQFLHSFSDISLVYLLRQVWSSLNTEFMFILTRPLQEGLRSEVGAECTLCCQIRSFAR
jgi:hypothetical protein